MKTFKLSLILLLMLGAFSCKKDSTSSNNAVTTDQAADIAASSLAENSEGLASVTDDIAVNAQGISSVNTGGLTINSTGQSTSSVHQECGTTLTDSVTRALTIDSVTVNYNFKYTHTLNCNNSVPDNLVNTLTYSGSFNGPRLTSSNSGSATVTIAGLSQSAANFVLNGEYKRSGSFQSKVGNDATGNSNVDIVGTNITLSKPDRKILSGSATIAITGTGPRGNSFSFTGNIVFNGDNTATLTINGTVYTINVVTGYRLRRL
jgi:hypothetical protein